jgi:hypothetical protein
MKTFILISIFSVATFSSAWSAPSKQREFQAKILSLRVEEMLHYRSQGLKACVAAHKGYSAQDFSKFQSDLKQLEGKFSSKEAQVEKSLEILVETEKNYLCAQEIAHADSLLNQLQRKKFIKPEKAVEASCLVMPFPASKVCLNFVTDVIHDIDPYCVTANSKDIFGYYDNNPCMAAVDILGRMTRKKHDPYQAGISNFLTKLESITTKAKPGATIDMWSLYAGNRKDTPELRKKFLGLMVFLYYTMGTAGGYVDGLPDYFWLGALKDHETATNIFEEYYSVRQVIDWYEDILNSKIKAHKLKLTIKKIPLKDMTHHDYVAMFLACHFKKYGNMTARLIPEILGYGYESLDYISHLKEKRPLKDNIKEFKRDTSSYVNGSKIGLEFCEMKF